MRRMLTSQLNNQLGQVSFDGLNAGVGQRLVELDLVGGQRLNLDHFFGLVRLDEAGDDLVGFGRVRRPVDMTTRFLHRSFQLQQVLV